MNMNYNAKQLVELGIITGPISKNNIQQVGVDLNLTKVSILRTPHDVRSVNNINVPEDSSGGKTVLLPRFECNLYERENTIDEGREVWILDPGTYEIEFAQGCNIPSNVMLLIRQRSSLLRNGAIIHSSVFDPGFKTDNMGTMMIVHERIVIEKNARVAQIYCHTVSPVDQENMYNGQFQGDAQRETK